MDLRDADATDAGDDAIAGSGQAEVLLLPALALMTFAALVVVAADWHSPIRTAITLAFLLFVPGTALAELLDVGDALQRIAIAPAASLAIETLVATALLWAGIFSVGGATVAVCAITCGLLLGCLRRPDDPGLPPEPLPDERIEAIGDGIGR